MLVTSSIETGGSGAEVGGTPEAIMFVGQLGT